MNHKTQAKRILMHYFTITAHAAGLSFDCDNESEVHDIVDHILAAAREQFGQRIADLEQEARELRETLWNMATAEQDHNHEPEPNTPVFVKQDHGNIGIHDRQTGRWIASVADVETARLLVAAKDLLAACEDGTDCGFEGDERDILDFAAQVVKSAGYTVLAIMLRDKNRAERAAIDRARGES